MENCSVEENVKLLMKELSELMWISPEGGEDENNILSKTVKSSEQEVHSICKKIYELRKVPNPEKKIAEDKLNTEVKQVMKYVKCLQECVIVQRLQKEQGSDKPKMYSCGDLESFTDSFSIPIGSGGFAKVYKGQFPDGTEIAVKVLEEKDVLDMFLAELSTMGRTTHQYLVKLYGYCFDKKMKALVYEYMENGSLADILHGNPQGLNWKKFYEIAIKIAEGLSFLHHDCPKTIIHHDIKPANVLIDSNLSPKITDFGLAKFMNHCLTHRTNTGLKGTTNFVAPEVICPGFEVNEKCDVYSFGMLLFEILGMKRLDQSKGWFPREVYRKFQARELDEVFEACSISHEISEDAKILSVVALWCVQFKLTARPSMSKVVRMLKKQITMLSPPDPFPQSAEFSVPTTGEVYPKSFISPFDESSVGIRVNDLLESVSVVESSSTEALQKGVAANNPKRYSSEDIESFTHNFSCEICSGEYGRVYAGQFPNGVKVAVKIISKKYVAEEIFIAEVSTIGTTHHLYLAKLYGYCFDEQMIALVHEYVEEGFFDKILYGNPHGLHWKIFYEIAICIAEGLSYLHHGCPQRIIHSDVKPGNVLIDSNLSPKITDFGLDQFHSSKDNAPLRNNSAMRGTADFLAPDMFIPGSRASRKQDVYSYGLLLFEILGMERNNRRNNKWFPTQLYKKFESGKLEQVLEKCGISEENREDAETLAIVALWCIQFTPKVRPSMRHVVEMLQKKKQVRRPPNPFVPSEHSSPTIEEEKIRECFQAIWRFNAPVNHGTNKKPSPQLLKNQEVESIFSAFHEFSMPEFVHRRTWM